MLPAPVAIDHSAPRLATNASRGAFVSSRVRVREFHMHEPPLPELRFLTRARARARISRKVGPPYPRLSEKSKPHATRNPRVRVRVVVGKLPPEIGLTEP